MFLFFNPLVLRFTNMCLHLFTLLDCLPVYPARYAHTQLKKSRQSKLANGKVVYTLLCKGKTSTKKPLSKKKSGYCQKTHDVLSVYMSTNQLLDPNLQTGCSWGGEREQIEQKTHKFYQIFEMWYVNELPIDLLLPEKTNQLQNC